VLRDLADVETHLVMSRWARTTIELETAYSVREVGKLADVVYGPGDQAAAISSGSFLTAGMVIVPCSMKTLAGIRTGYADGLIARAADVCLKERRRLVLVPRETPLSDVHLENMLALSRMGATIFRPSRPSTTIRRRWPTPWTTWWSGSWTSSGSPLRTRSAGAVCDDRHTARSGAAAADQTPPTATS
jgi:polyprenyl P-hydroxybenzoate/phenylacrylic acid decarboxylase-like protein